VTAVVASSSLVLLRGLTEDDFNYRYVAWFADPLVTRFLSARNISRDDAIAHMRRGRVGNAWYMYAICAVEDGRHIGNLKIGPISYRHMTSDMVTVIGDRTAWGQGRARQAIALGIEIAFTQFNIRKLSASIDSDNVGSIKAYTGAGFHIETTLKDQFMDVTQVPPKLSDKVYVACFNPKFQMPKKD
jgi:[ribosomal protein S5]-alanine N-acetyltransferase